MRMGSGSCRMNSTGRGEVRVSWDLGACNVRALAVRILAEEREWNRGRLAGGLNDWPRVR